jgi:hypothetical protein
MWKFHGVKSGTFTFIAVVAGFNYLEILSYTDSIFNKNVTFEKSHNPNM